MTDDDNSDSKRLEIIRAILAEPVPRWFQNAHRRANVYAQQLRRIAEVAGDAPTRAER
jgi:hypothetical protein